MRFALASVLVAALSAAAAAQEPLSLDGDARTDLALTIYRDDFAVVHDTRSFALAAGETRVVFRGIASAMAPETAILRTEDARLVEADFQLAPLTPRRLSSAAVGETVQVYRPHPRTGEDRVETATLLAAEEGVLLEIDGRIERLADLPGRLVYPELPPGLTRRPQIAALLDSAREGKRRVTLTYQTSGLGWRADYVARLAEDEESLDLTARARLANDSGLDIEDGAVELVAGEIKRVRDGRDGGPELRRQAVAAQSDRGDTTARSLHDVHLYSLERPLTLRDGGRKQMRLFGAQAVAAEKTYRFTAGGFSSFERPRPARVHLAFANREDGALGRPLPAGTLRVYAAHGGGQERLRLLGEDRLPPTPKGQRAELALGPAFEVTVEGQARDRRMLVNTRERRVYEADQRYILRNAREREVVVALEQAMPGRDWQILEASRETAQTRAGSAAWRIPVPSEGEAQLDFTVRVEE